jgi:hypothetical protein
MGLTMYAKDIFILTTISGLFLIGLALTLKSGMVSVGCGQGRQLWNNASQLAVALAGCAAFLLMIQQIAGIRVGSFW